MIVVVIILLILLTCQIYTGGNIEDIVRKTHLPKYTFNIYLDGIVPIPRRYLKNREILPTAELSGRCRKLTDINLLLIGLQNNITDFVIVGGIDNYVKDLFPNCKFYTDKPDGKFMLISHYSLDIAHENNYVINNVMKEQRSLVERLQPTMSAVRFKLPLDTTEYGFYSGKLYIPPYRSQLSAETYIIFTVNEPKLYNTRLYYDTMFSFNTLYRTMWFDHDIKLDGIDHCWDCKHEIETWKLYNRIVDNSKSVEKLITEIDSHSMRYIAHGLESDEKDYDIRMENIQTMYPDIYKNKAEK